MGPDAVDTSTILPLTTGNSWTYFQKHYYSNGTLYDTLTYTQTIVDAEFVGNDKWFLIQEKRKSFVDTLYVTHRYDGIWILPVGTTYPAFMLFQFPVSAGDSYASGPDGLTQMTLIGTSLTQTVPAGTFSPCFDYKQQTMGRTDYNRRILCPGVGEVASTTYSALPGGGEYVSVVSQLQSYVIR
jgi:hypothetical protein